MILNAIKAVFHRLAPLSEEDRVINSAKAGVTREFRTLIARCNF